MELVYGPGKRTSSSGGDIPCPYLTLPFAELRAGHDQIYFGHWRKAESTQSDIRRAYNQLGRHLTAIGDTLSNKELPSAQCDLAKAREACLSGDPREDSPDLLLRLDNALSYAHRAINDLLHESGLPSHHPMDFASWYDAPEVPFQDDL
ncbi:MAG TPA: hypothetical protein DD658_05195 [Deltaproteobacteria bacterium]|nr:hypothetical protein [Deltaproteobacteria bacterium]